MLCTLRFLNKEYEAVPPYTLLENLPIKPVAGEYLMVQGKLYQVSLCYFVVRKHLDPESTNIVIDCQESDISPGIVGLD